ncbi:MAG: energy transducer TonB, partial [Syntrophales bacterium LBB04]|nr:energy transducer TonB [Syntrophales bacterium LBB04]
LHGGSLLLIFVPLSGAALAPSLGQGLPVLQVSWVSLPTEAELTAARQTEPSEKSANGMQGNQKPLPVDPKDRTDRESKPIAVVSDLPGQRFASLSPAQPSASDGDVRRSGDAAGGPQAPAGSFTVSLSGQGSARGMADESSPAGKIVLAYPRYGANVYPRYPEIARLRGYEGVVLLSAEIHADGTVGVLMIKRSSGYTILDRSAYDAVRTWKFEPGREMGRPRTMWVDVPVKFVLREG